MKEKNVIIRNKVVFKEQHFIPFHSEWKNALTARLVDGNDVMGMKCCNGNSNEGMDMSIGNEDSFFWCA